VSLGPFSSLSRFSYSQPSARAPYLRHRSKSKLKFLAKRTGKQSRGLWNHLRGSTSTFSVIGPSPCTSAVLCRPLHLYTSNFSSLQQPYLKMLKFPGFRRRAFYRLLGTKFYDSADFVLHLTYLSTFWLPT
jgi:hypothetical protein